MRNKIIIAWWIVLIIALLISFGFWLGDRADAELNDETLKLVNNLRWKHGRGYNTLTMSDTTDWDFIYDWTTISFDDELGILYVETNNGKWYIEMKEEE